MKRILPVLSSIFLMLTGCGLFYKGPDETSVVQIARQQMIANAPSPAHRTAAEQADYRSKGRCTVDENRETLYRCGVEVTLTLNDITAKQSQILLLIRKQDGNWSVYHN